MYNYQLYQNYYYKLYVNYDYKLYINYDMLNYDKIRQKITGLINQTIELETYCIQIYDNVETVQ